MNNQPSLPNGMVLRDKPKFREHSRAIGFCAIVFAAVLLASCGFLKGDGQSVAEREFCQSATQWHSTFSTYLRRMNSSGSRTADGWSQSYDALKPNLLVVLKDGGNDEQRGLRDLLRAATKNAELWMTQLQQYHITLGGSGVSNADASVRATLLSAIFEADRIAELTRIEGNDLGREASFRLAEACGLEPLPIYSD